MTDALTLKLSIIIPTYNEEKRLPFLLSDLVATLNGLAVGESSNTSCEVVLVDDGSTDNTVEVAEGFRELLPQLRVIKIAHNRGKGAALIAGLSSARGEISVMIDADGAYDPREIIVQQEKILANHCDILIGCRILAPNPEFGRSKWRLILSRSFNALVRLILELPYLETQAGFKLFRTELIQPLLPKLRLTRFGFDAELLYLAHHSGLRIKEFPVGCRDTGPSKVRLIFDSFDLLRSLFRIRHWHKTTRIKSDF